MTLFYLALRRIRDRLYAISENFMNKIIYSLKSKTPTIVLILLAVAALLQLIATIGGMGGNNAGAIIGEFISLLVYIGVCGVLAFAILTKRSQVATIVGGIGLGYLALSRTLSLAAYFFDTATGIFYLLTGLCVIALIVFFIIALVKPEYKKNPALQAASFWVIAAYCLLAFVTAILMIVVYARFNAGWTNYFIAFCYLAEAALIAFGFLWFQLDAEEPVAIAEEAPAEEAPVEEAIPEEPKEEPQEEEPAPEEEAPKDNE